MTGHSETVLPNSRERSRQEPKSLRILIVEDEPAIREALGRVLSSRGHRVETSDELGRARELLQENLYDAAVVDLHLDRANSRGLIGHAPPGTRIMFLTGDPGGAWELSQKGLPVLMKPLEMNAFIRAVETTVAAGKAQSPRLSAQRDLKVGGRPQCPKKRRY